MNGLIELIRTGKTYHVNYGEIDITPADIDTAIANHTKRPKMGAHVKHGTHATNLAGGWIEGMSKVQNDDGSYSIMSPVEWTDEAHSDVDKKKLKYISPEFHRDFIDKETGDKQGFTILGAALLNDPQLDMMRDAVALAQSDDKNYYCGVLSYAIQPTEENMDLKPLALKLGLDESATMEEIMLAIESITGDSAKVEEVTAELAQIKSEKVELSQTAETANEAVVKLTQDVTERDDQIVKLSAEVDTLKAEKSETESREWVRKLTQDEGRKLTPAQSDTFFKLHQADPTSAQSVVDSLPVLEKIGEITGSGGDPVTDPTEIQLSQVKAWTDSGVSSAEAHMRVAKGHYHG